MPESANRAAGIVYSATTPFTPEEYVKTLLETGTPVEVVEKFLVKKIEELDNNLRDLRENKADEAEISKVEKELKKYMIKSIFLWVFLIAAIIGVGFYGYIYVFEKGEYNLLGMKDTIIPNFHSIEIYSNNMYNPNFAEVGDTITIKLKATE